MEIKTNQIINGDCLELMAKLPDQSIDMILCDLPYGTTALKWDTIIPFNELWEQYERLIKENGAIVLFGKNPFTAEVWFVNKLQPYNIDWEIDRMDIHDADYNTGIPLIANGRYGLKINDSIVIVTILSIIQPEPRTWIISIVSCISFII